MHIKLKKFPYEKNLSTERSFYSKKKRKLLVEQGALNNEEDGFMQGYENALQGL
jgi:hypothetical protein